MRARQRVLVGGTSALARCESVAIASKRSINNTGELAWAMGRDRTVTSESHWGHGDTQDRECWGTGTHGTMEVHRHNQPWGTQDA
jgi:hypothetical protein